MTEERFPMVYFHDCIKRNFFLSGRATERHKKVYYGVMGSMSLTLKILASLCVGLNSITCGYNFLEVKSPGPLPESGSTQGIMLAEICTNFALEFVDSLIAFCPMETILSFKFQKLLY